MSKKFLALLCCGLLASCGGGSSDSGPPVIVGGGGSADECSITNQNQSLIDYLQADYYWYQNLPNLTASSFDSPYDVLDAARVPEDRFSFIITEEQYIASYVNASSVAYGFSYRLANDNQSLEIRFVYDNGSAHDAGLARGDRITAINGVAVETLVQQVSTGNNSWSNIFGDSVEGVSGFYTWQKPDGQEVSADLVKTEIDTNTVFHHQVFNSTNDKSVGYMVFNRFIERSKEDLNNVFNDFAAQNVDELIVDLRYNGGGLVSVANQLATQVAGTNVDGQTFANLVYNDKRQGNNQTYPFALGDGILQLNLDRVVILTTEATCSASEMVINSLSPYIDVVTVGNNTCGKPIGMNPVQICDKVVFAINFETTNGVDVGGYFDGLPAQCFAQDQIVGDWGNIQDPLLAEGLFYLNNEQCFSLRRPAVSPVENQQLNWTHGPFAIDNVI